MDDLTIFPKSTSEIKNNIIKFIQQIPNRKFWYYRTILSDPDVLVKNILNIKRLMQLESLLMKGQI
jgi:hypothetical protein